LFRKAVLGATHKETEERQKEKMRVVRMFLNLPRKMWLEMIWDLLTFFHTATSVTFRRFSCYCTWSCYFSLL